MENARTTHRQAFDPSSTRKDALGEAMYDLLSVILAPVIAALIEKLMQLLAAWRDGTLPPMPEPALRIRPKSNHRHPRAARFRRRTSAPRPESVRAVRPATAPTWAAPSLISLPENPRPPRVERPPKSQNSSF